MKPIEHGTRRGYAAHLRRREPACRPCLAANAAAARGERTPRELIPCPSEPAYHRHRRNREEACDGCKAAHAAYEAEKHAARRERAA